MDSGPGNDHAKVLIACRLAPCKSPGKPERHDKHWNDDEQHDPDHHQNGIALAQPDRTGRVEYRPVRRAATADPQRNRMSASRVATDGLWVLFHIALGGYAHTRSRSVGVFRKFPRKNNRQSSWHRCCDSTCHRHVVTGGPAAATQTHTGD